MNIFLKVLEIYFNWRGTLYCLPRLCLRQREFLFSKNVSEYDQEIPQSQAADNPVAPRGRAAQSSRDTRARNYNAFLELRKT